MKTVQTYRKLIFSIFALLFLQMQVVGQMRKVQNQPYADQKLYHIGFSVGLCAEDLILKHTGAVTSTGESWYGEIPSYSAGFTVGFIADRYINQYLNVRMLPTLYFGEKNYEFRETTTQNKYSTTIRNNYLSLPVLVKFSAQRVNNYRPYVLGGVYVSTELGGVKNQAVRLKNFDYGLQFGLGCNFYLPLFKFCPELRFSLGLRDLIDKERKDLTDNDLRKYTDALASGKSKMVSLILNFE